MPYRLHSEVCVVSTSVYGPGSIHGGAWIIIARNAVTEMDFLGGSGSRRRVVSLRGKSKAEESRDKVGGSGSSCIRLGVAHVPHHLTRCVRGVLLRRC
jgi:hypothetical protein